MPDKFGWDNNFGNSRPPSRRPSITTPAPKPPGWPYVDPPAFDEERCPGHVALGLNPKICANCGTHIDSLRPPEEDEEMGRSP